MPRIVFVDGSFYRFKIRGLPYTFGKHYVLIRLSQIKCGILEHEHRMGLTWNDKNVWLFVISR